MVTSTTSESPPPGRTTRLVAVAIVAAIVIAAAVVGTWLISGQDEAPPEATPDPGELKVVTTPSPAPEATGGRVADTLGALGADDLEPGSVTSPEASPMPSPEFLAGGYLFQYDEDPDYRIRVGPGDSVAHIVVSTGVQNGIYEWFATGDGGIIHYWKDYELDFMGVPAGDVSDAYLTLHLDERNVLTEICRIVIDGQSYGYEHTAEYIGPAPPEQAEY